jgi:hypothetical protein
MGAKGRIKLNGSLPNGSQEALPWKKREQEKKEKLKKMFVKKKETREKYNKRDFVLHGNKRRRKVFFQDS